MALPTKTNLLTLDYTYLGEPFCNVPAKSSIDLSSADYVYQGEPFVSNPDTSGGSVNVTLSPVTISATIPTPTVTGDSNITLTPLSTSVTILDVVVTTNLRFWIGGTGNWTDTTHWAVSSGGTSGADVPTSSDDVFIDASSGAGIITFDLASSCKNFDASNSSITTFSGTVGLSVYGNFTLKTGLTWNHSGDIIFSGSGSFNITTVGVNIGATVHFNNVGGTWAFQDSLTSSTNYLGIEAGLVDFNDKNITALGIYANYGVADASLDLGNGTITFNGDYYDCDLSDVEITNAGSGTIVISGDNMTVRLPPTANGAINNVSIIGDDCLIIGAATMNTLSIDASPLTVVFYQNTTYIVSDFQATGSVGNVITIDSYDGATQFTLSKSSGTVNCDYLNISNSNASGGATWIANNSVDTTNNDGWLFYVNTILTPIDAGTTTLLAPTVIGDANSNLTLINAGSVVTLTPTATADASVTLSAITLSITIPEVSVDGDANVAFSSILALTAVFIEPTISVERNWGNSINDETNWVDTSVESTNWTPTATELTSWSNSSSVVTDWTSTDNSSSTWTPVDTLKQS